MIDNFDKDRIIRIAFITNELHDLIDCLYEALCDEEDEEAMKALVILEVQLRLLKESFSAD